jgi:hypothetical protein
MLVTEQTKQMSGLFLGVRAVAPSLNRARGAEFSLGYWDWDGWDGDGWDGDGWDGWDGDF